MNDSIIRSATLSEDFRYRYALERRWTSIDPARFVLWVMLNPSTADAQKDDATIRKCIGFTKNWGLSRLVVVNLFAYRTTYPGELLSRHDPVGPENDYYISLWSHLVTCKFIVCAWGSLGFIPKASALRERSEKVLSLLPLCSSPQIFCLGTSKSGDPRHPSRIGYVTALQPFNQRSSAAKGRSLVTGDVDELLPGGTQ